MIARVAVVIVSVLISLSQAAAEGCNETHCVERSAISGGAVTAESSDGQWRVSGTLGQWEASKAGEITNGTHKVTGGFWVMTLEEAVDSLFSDRFEGNNG